MIGAIIGAIGSIAAAGIGAAQSAKQARNARNERDAERQRWDDWKSRIDNEDPMQLASVQAANAYASEMARDMLSAAKGRQAVMGGGGHEVAAAQEAALKAKTDVARDAMTMGQARKDAADSKYMDVTRGISSERTADYYNQASNIANAASSGIQAGLQMAGADAQAHLNNSKGMFETMWDDGSKWMRSKTGKK